MRTELILKEQTHLIDTLHYVLKAQIQFFFFISTTLKKNHVDSETINNISLLFSC